MIIKAFIIAFLLISSASVAIGQTYRDYDSGLIVEATDPEGLKQARNAAQKAYEFFRWLGYHNTIPVRIRFQPVVLYRWADKKTERVYAYADEKQHIIYMTQWDESWLVDQKVFGQKLTPELYQSILVHELCHLLANAAAGKILGTAVSEYIAYVAQIQSLKEQTIRRIIANYHTDPFKTREINSFNLWKNAHRFGIRSYLHFKKTGNYFLTDVLKGRMDPDKKLMASMMSAYR